jgi:hypothetical protein
MSYTSQLIRVLEYIGERLWILKIE